MTKHLKVVVAISGGVDSSVAAFLLQKQSYEVIGIFMRLGIDGEDGEAAARRVCQKLNIKFYPINLAREFKKEVIDYFLNGYAHGLTPNPCVKCNQFIKFNGLLKLAEKLGAGYLATGHYAKKLKTQNSKLKTFYKLYRGKDKDKDQSYFLYNLTQSRLAHILFPLGDYTKEEIRKIADKAKLPYLTKESQDICFLKGAHNDFLRQRLKLKPGPIKVLLPLVTPLTSPLARGDKEELLKGKTIGEHQGLPLYTIGQRRGVEIGGIGPFYAAKCDYKTNTLYVANNADDPALYSDELIAKDINWIAGQEPKTALSCEAVIRYRHKPVKCEISAQGGYKYLIKFSKPQRAITPGQSVVFYQGDEILGGGVIK